MTRQIEVQPRKARARITTYTLRSVKAFRTTIAPSRNGMPKKMSVTRDMTESSQPPK